MVKNPAGIARYLAAAGELTDVPGRSPPRAPPYWKSQVLRRQALGDQGEGGDDQDRPRGSVASGREARNSAAVAEPRALRGFGAPQPLGGGAKRARLLPNYAPPDAHRRTAAARMGWRSALVSLTAAFGRNQCGAPPRADGRQQPSIPLVVPAQLRLF